MGFVMRSLVVLLTTGLVTACGAAGPPVAPETIGVAPVIERQKQQQGEEAPEPGVGESNPDALEQDAELPSLE